MLSRQIGRRCSSGETGLELFPAAHTIAKVFHHFAQGDAERQLETFGPVEMTRKTEQLGTGAFRIQRQFMKPNCTVRQNMWHGGQGFNVVNVGRLAEQPALSRKRWFGTRIGPAAFEAVKQGGLLSENVTAGTAMYMQFDIEI